MSFTVNISRFLTPLIVIMIGSCATAPAPVENVLPAAGHQTGIVGMVTTSNGAPAEGAYVYAYRSMKSSLRGPADFEAAVDKDGRYFLDLIEGNYYLVARLRQTGADAGPPRIGDAWSLPSKNPITVITDDLTSVSFTLQGVSQPMLMREGTLTSGNTGFTGRLVNQHGEPLPGAFVIAYPEPDYQRMPQATSPAVGDDGRFNLFVKRTGQWCLAARTRTRGQPIAGELYGLLGNNSEGCRNAVSGQIIDIGTIRLSPYK
jgi:hypothetical protein